MIIYMPFGDLLRKSEEQNLHLHWPPPFYQCNLFSMRAIHIINICHTAWKSIFDYLYSLLHPLHNTYFYRLNFFPSHIFIACYYSTSMIYDNSHFFAWKNSYSDCILFFPFHVFFIHIHKFHTLLPQVEKKWKGFW